MTTPPRQLKRRKFREDGDPIVLFKNAEGFWQEPPNRLVVIEQLVEKIRVKRSDCTHLFMEIRELMKGHELGEEYVIDEVLWLILNVSKDETKLKLACELINDCLNDYAHQYEFKLTVINNFIIDEELSLLAQKTFVESIKFSEEFSLALKESEQKFYYFKLCYNLEAVRKSPETRRILNANFRNVMNSALHEKEQEYFLECIIAIMNDLRAANLHAIGDEILQDLAKDIKLQCASDIIFCRFMTFHNDFARFNSLGISMYFYSLEQQLKDNDFANALKVIRKSYVVLTRKGINRIEYLQVKSLLKTITGTDRVKVTQAQTLVNLLEKDLFEKTTEAFLGFYVLVWELCSFVSKIDNHPKYSVSCCYDLKRHTVFKLCERVVTFAKYLVDKEVFDLNIAQKVKIFLKFYNETLQDLNCPKKPSMATIAFENVLNDWLYLFYEKFHNHKPEYAELIDQIAQATYSSLELSTDETKKKFQKLVMVLQQLGRKIEIYNPDQAKHVASFLTRALICILKYTEYSSEKEKRSEVMRNLLSIREAAMAGGYKSATEFIMSREFHKELNMTETEINAHEIVALTRLYPKGTDDTTTLFEEFYNRENIDLPSASIVSQVLSEKILVSDDESTDGEKAQPKLDKKGIKMKKFKAMHERLQTYADKQIREHEIAVYLALACNHYTLFNYAHTKLIKKFNDFNKEKSKWVNNTEFCKIVEQIKFEEELEVLENLTKSIQNFAMVVKCIQANPKSAEKIVSDARIQKILDNISIICHVRGIDYMDMEAQIILWKLFTKNATPLQILSSATVIIDHACQSPKPFDSSLYNTKISTDVGSLDVHEVCHEAFETYKKVKIEEVKEKDRIVIINFVLTVWNHYLKKYDGAFYKNTESELPYWWKEFEKLFDTFDFKNNEAIQSSFESKLLTITVEMYQNEFNTTALHHLYASVTKIMKIKSILPEFSNLFQQIYRRVTTKAIQYSLNRHVDLDHYKVAMLTLKQSALLNGYYLRSLEFISLSIMRNLNMEKLELVKTELRELFVLLRIEDKVMNKNNSKQPAIVVTNVEQMQQIEVNRRDASKENTEILLKTDNMQITNDTATIIEELKRLIHDDGCKCNNCKYPVLKFYAFQLACHYSRLFWLMGKKEITKEFNDFAYERWKTAYNKVVTSDDSSIFGVNETDFIVFSTRWLFQVADNLVQLKTYDQIEKIYEQIKKINNRLIPDYNCLVGKLKARREFLAELISRQKIENGEVQEPTEEYKQNERKFNQRAWAAASFEEFLVRRANAANGREKEIKLPRTGEPEILYEGSRSSRLLSVASAKAMQSAKNVKSSEVQTSQSISSKKLISDSAACAEMAVALPSSSKKSSPVETAMAVKSTTKKSASVEAISASRVKKISPTEKLIVEAFSSIKISAEVTTSTSKKTSSGSSSSSAGSSRKVATSSSKTVATRPKKPSPPKDDSDVIYIDDSSDEDIPKKPVVTKKKTTATSSSAQPHSTRSRTNNLSQESTPKTSSISTRSRRIL